MDIIIPVFNNLNGLQHTLMSLYADEFNVELHIIIIDDNSSIDYTNILNYFKTIFNITYIRNSKRLGPGLSRNIGLNYIKTDWTFFLDCGDVIQDIINLKLLLKLLKENDDSYDIIVSHHCIERENGECIPAIRNNYTLHDKVFRNTFIKNYQINFVNFYSFGNEDVGFYCVCKYLAKDRIIYNNKTLILQTYDENSLSRMNDCYFYYHENNLSLAYNIGQAIEILKLYNIDLKEEIYGTLLDLYITYLESLNVINSDPQLTRLACKYFYDRYAKSIIDFNDPLLIEMYYDRLNCATNFGSPIRRQLLTIDLKSFLDTIDKEPEFTKENCKHLLNI